MRRRRDRQRLAARQAVAAVVAQRIEAAGIAGERAVGHHLDLGQERGQGARRGGLGGAALAADQHAADAVADGVQDQGALHALLADDGGEGIRSDDRHVMLRFGFPWRLYHREAGSWKLDDSKLEAGGSTVRLQTTRGRAIMRFCTKLKGQDRWQNMLLPSSRALSEKTDADQ